MTNFSDKPSARNCRRRERRGFVLVAVIVLIAFATTLFGLWAKAAVQRHRQTRGQHFRFQAERLAEAGLQRAVVQLTATEDYDGETWSIPAGVLHATQTATINIRIAPADNANALRLEAVAEFPAGALHRAQITRTINIATPTSRDET